MERQAQYGGSAAAGQTIGAERAGGALKAVQVSELARIQSRIEEVGKRLWASGAHLHGINDRVFGPQNETNGGMPKPCGDRVEPPALGRLHDALLDLEAGVALLETQVGRTSEL